MTEGLKNRKMIVLKDFCTPPLPYPVALRGVAIGETPKKLPFLRRGVKYARTIFTDSRIEYVFIALNGCKADSLRAGRTKGPSFCFF